MRDRGRPVQRYYGAAVVTGTTGETAATGSTALRWRSWRVAMQGALYGATGFYRRNLPGAHFRTAASSPVFADAIARLTGVVDEALGRPSAMQVVDVGAGAGEVLRALADQVPAHVRLTGVDIGPRPAGLPDRIAWTSTIPPSVVGVVLANEWLDNVPLDVVEVDDDGITRIVEVELRSGQERLGSPVAGRDADWLARWWPMAGAMAGMRAEVGWPRDDRWADCLGHLDAGVAVAIDYDHLAGARPVFGTLVGFRDGRMVEPIPDGSCDITAHVALDACATAPSATEAVGTLTRQADALRVLGVSGTRPTFEPGGDAPAYVRDLARASEAAFLTAVDGLGGFGWLAHARGLAVPFGVTS